MSFCDATEKNWKKRGKTWLLPITFSALQHGHDGNVFTQSGLRTACKRRRMQAGYDNVALRRVRIVQKYTSAS
jgi:hypothetical protein